MNPQYTISLTGHVTNTFEAAYAAAKALSKKIGQAVEILSERNSVFIIDANGDIK